MQLVSEVVEEEEEEEEKKQVTMNNILSEEPTEVELPILWQLASIQHSLYF